MEDSAQLFIALGATFLIGLAANTIGRRTRLPRVSLLLVLGFLIGPTCLDLLPEGRETMFRLAANVALTMVGFLLGEKLGLSIRSHEGRPVWVISGVLVVVTAAMVFLGLWAMGMPMVVALLLAGVATATDPAATEDVIRESKAKGPFSRLISGIVAVDDAWGLLLFSLLLAVGQMMTGNGGEAMEPIWEGLREIGGAIVVGGGLGVVMAFLTGRIEKGEPTVLEAVGFVMLVCGVSLYCGVSFILAAMTMGTVVSLLAKHHRRPFHVIENIEFPFMIVFFVLAGAALEPRALAGMGWYGFGYILLRAASRLVGGWLGGAAAGVDDGTRRLVGMALMPQAGVALGMALLAAEQIPSVGGVVLQAAIGSTVIFEVVGPVFTRHALNRCGETRD